MLCYADVAILKSMNILNELFSPSLQPSPAKKQRRCIEIKSEREIAIMRQAGKIVAIVLKEISERSHPPLTPTPFRVPNRTTQVRLTLLSRVYTEA
jgi:hypothetical protein